LLIPLLLVIVKYSHNFASQVYRTFVLYWSLDILEGPTWAKGLWFYQAAAAWTMVWQVAGALPVAKVIGWSASCWRKSVTNSRQEGRLAPRRHLGKGA
jgi:hypothetical protein